MKQVNQKIPLARDQRSGRLGLYLIATASPDLTEHCRQGVADDEVFSGVSDWPSLTKAMKQLHPRILLLDFELPGVTGVNSVVDLRALSPQTRIVVASDALPDEMALALFKSGVRGLCARDIDAAMVGRIFPAIEDGELWIRHSLTQRLLAELSPRAAAQVRPGNIVVDRLTGRQQEIALLIADGNSNKQIARTLDITESTVKAHLTEIFRKAGIVDRLQLALVVAGSGAGRSGWLSRTNHDHSAGFSMFNFQRH